MNVKELRIKYPAFIYKSFDHRLYGSDLVMSFEFLTPPLEFHPKVVIRNIPVARFKSLDKSVLDNLIFHLGLAEVPSYWKATCSPIIQIDAGRLSSEQIDWWHKLLIKGMGQYFYENKIDFTQNDFLTITSNGKGEFSKAEVRNKKILIPVGGGKDSAVTLGIVSKNFDDVGAAILENTNTISNIEPSVRLAKMSKTKEIIIVERTIDQRLLDLNKEGFLNGHTPFSSYLAFLFILVAYLFDYKYLTLSNERSSDESNTEYLGEKINHQYTKTFEFEKDFKKYNEKYLSNVNYFSFLRPLYELQIARIFSNYPKYFSVIRSCNVGAKAGVWCCHCPKCLSTFILLQPFFKDKILEVFPRNLMEDKTLTPLLNTLVSKNSVKPFECIGTRDEFVAALESKDKPELFNEILNSWGDNNLPKKFETLLMKELNE